MASMTTNDLLPLHEDLASLVTFLWRRRCARLVSKIVARRLSANWRAADRRRWLSKSSLICSSREYCAERAPTLAPSSCRFRSNQSSTFQWWWWWWASCSSSNAMVDCCRLPRNAKVRKRIKAKTSECIGRILKTWTPQVLLQEHRTGGKLPLGGGRALNQIDCLIKLDSLWKRTMDIGWTWEQDDERTRFNHFEHILPPRRTLWKWTIL